jgi:photosynthetic reaction center cytochrome c subunit
MSRVAFKSFYVLAAALLAMLLGGCERPPVTATQNGYRGTGMEQVVNPRLQAALNAANRAPATTPPVGNDGPKASEVYQNVKVLGHLSVAEFTRNMLAITAWVAPKEGCAYCHNLQNLADDSKYTKVVARRMIQMTQGVNGEWKQHVGATGVTCYTCHRGNAVPAQVWYAPTDRKYAANSLMGDLAGQNLASPSVGLSSLPFDPFTPYLKEDKPIRVNGTQALKFTGVAANRTSTKQAEHTYGLMMHMSNALGVNCTFCHNTRNFASWSEAPPQRVTAWHGIRMARNLNNAYLEPLTGTFPANRLGAKGDVAKVNCATCHQGVNKPLNGAKMAKDYPALLTASPVVATVTAAPADAPAPDINGVLGKILFDSGKATLAAQAQTVIEAAAALLAKNPAVKIALSGYADRTGNANANLELAKQRAFAVRDALKAAGVAEDRIALKKPEFVIGGAESDARRVEIIAAK